MSFDDVFDDRQSQPATFDIVNQHVADAIEFFKDFFALFSGYADAEIAPNETFRRTNIRGSGGAGLKAGVYPGAMGLVLGLEGEFFGHGGRLKTPGAFPSADANLLVLNWMLNVLARYPGEVFQPYVGAGAGASLANLRDITLQTSSGTMTGKAGDVAFAYQFLAGMRTYVNKNVYLFGEYKYFGST